ncbi:protein AGENET DOMAIN (AGD)-CONTAINING P1-like isoform X2 [Rhodamnia argentea]|uniref:Protein AGENET DOMAIN (AGD)-CONTAINING P1-like isoform X2 n=1 Tax=Rhodamnia argentea TaxID=178133 RepID=A0ABM3HJI6_9MYRT|nr:protein AGENET DOMAIN (AGD)-CONTAINING P1-like isoform X2 [Rhodamnia argentea]
MSSRRRRRRRPPGEEDEEAQQHQQQQQPPPNFEVGTLVEIASTDDGFRGSWYAATVIRGPSPRSSSASYVVEFQEIYEDEAGTRRVTEEVEESQIRPIPPNEPNVKRDFEVGDEVEARQNDGWWEGVVVERLRGGRFGVLFEEWRERVVSKVEDLRLNRKWVHGSWLPPSAAGVEDPQKAQSQLEMKVAKKMKSNEFTRGTPVEVSSDEDGYRGAWFAAVVVEEVSKGKYLVEYENLRTEDNAEFLKEEADALHIRPCPPEIVVADHFNLFDEVDALYNDGWWVGVVSKVLSKSWYVVYFRDTKEELEFRHSNLRLHQEWIGGRWMIASFVQKTRA